MAAEARRKGGLGSWGDSPLGAPSSKGVLAPTPYPTSCRMEGAVWTRSGAAVPSLNVPSVEMGRLMASPGWVSLE